MKDIPAQIAMTENAEEKCAETTGKRSFADNAIMPPEAMVFANVTVDSIKIPSFFNAVILNPKYKSPEIKELRIAPIMFILGCDMSATDRIILTTEHIRL